MIEWFCCCSYADQVHRIPNSEMVQIAQGMTTFKELLSFIFLETVPFFFQSIVSFPDDPLAVTFSTPTTYHQAGTTQDHLIKLGPTENIGFFGTPF